jgi:hypothetical protein
MKILASLFLFVSAPLIASDPDERLMLPMQLDGSISCNAPAQKRVVASTARELFGDSWAERYSDITLAEASELRQAKAPVLKISRQRESSAGMAEVRALVGEDGRVLRAYVTCSTDPRHDEAIVAAMMKATFSPVIARGEPMPTLMKQTFTF